MNADRLLAHYEQIADAPEAIAHLRRFILDLAVRWRLVEQDPTDEPASELLKRIAAEKARLVSVREIKTQKPLPKITHDEALFNLPNNWSWARLSEITVCLDYMRKPINGAERAKRIEGKSEEELFPYYGATQQQGWIDDFLFDEELVLLGEDGVPFFDPFRSKAYLVSGKTWVNNHAHVFRGIFVSHPYLVHVLNVFDYTGRVVGATRSKLNQSRAVDIPIALPPLAEQHRIIAKVDELMALCDRLEVARAEREATRDRLASASLARLNAPDPDPTVFKGHAAFAIENLAPLTTGIDQTKALRQTILNLAVCGKLVEQDRADEPASELLKRIAAEKARLVKAEVIKRPKQLRAVESDDTEFCIPSSWCWTRLGEVTSYIQRGKSPKYASKSGALVVSQKCVQWSGLNLNKARKITYQSLAAYEDIRFLREGDLLWNSTGTGTIGRVIRLIDSPERLVCDSHVTVVRCLLVSPEYIRTWLRTGNVYGLIEERATGSTNQVELTAQMALNQVVPLPPLAEQHRIVAKVDELMALCDRLEINLGIADTGRQHLLESLLRDVLVPSNEPCKVRRQ